MYQIAVLLIMIGHFVDEPASGIYIIQPLTKRSLCTNESKMIIGNERVCLSPKPILDRTSLQGASEIKYDGYYKVHYIELGITPQASKTLQQTKKSLPTSKFALAINGDVICVFTIKEDFMVKSFRIGEDITLADLMRIHEILEGADL